MHGFKRVLNFLAAGALLGGVVATFLGARAIVWYMEPGSGVQSMCNCGAVARDTADRLITTQLVGAGIGAVAFAVLSFFVGKKKPVAPPAALP